MGSGSFVTESPQISRTSATASSAIPISFDSERASCVALVTSPSADSWHVPRLHHQKHQTKARRRR